MVVKKDVYVRVVEKISKRVGVKYERVKFKVLISILVFEPMRESREQRTK